MLKLIIARLIPEKFDYPPNLLFIISGDFGRNMKNIITSNQELEIVSYYLECENRDTVRSRYNLSLYKFYDVMRRHGVANKNYRHHSLYNKNAFRNFNLDSKAAYFYGLILSDGNLFNGRVQFNCQAQDSPILEELRSYIGSSSKIHYLKRNNSSYFSFADKRIVERLVEQGLEAKKSNQEKLPLFDWINSPDFIRGLIDGDGSISISTSGSPSIDLCGSYEVVNGFISYVDRHIQPKVHKNARLSHLSGLYRVGYYGDEAVRLLKNLYYDGCTAIPRKQQSVNKIMEKRNELYHYSASSFKCS